MSFQKEMSFQLLLEGEGEEDVFLEGKGDVLLEGHLFLEGEGDVLLKGHLLLEKSF